ncbi:MAG: S8 family serine peptidase [Actinomycetes bacterium]
MCFVPRWDRVLLIIIVSALFCSLVVMRNESVSAVTTMTVPSCDGMATSAGLTRDQLAVRYGIDDLHAAGYTGSGLVVVVIEGATSIDRPLIDQFLSCQNFPGVRVETQWVAPASNVPAGNEATVDVETLAQFLPDVGTIHVLQQPTGGSFGTRFESTLTHLLDQMDRGTLIPDVISMSTGTCEESVTPQEVATIEAQLQRLAEAGVWFMKSAGDAGSSDCAGHESCATANTQLAVEYPTTSKWLTAVGGSQFAGSAPDGVADVWKGPCAAGGGGTSIRVSRPTWQTGVGVESDFRMIPDLTGLAGTPKYLTLVPDANRSGNPGWEGDGGTSLSTPLYAAGVGLVRQAMRVRGIEIPKQLTPDLYRIATDPALRAKVFTDVTVGDNDLYSVGCCQARAGYDLASGWGEMNVSGLLEVLAPIPVGPVVPAFTG